MSLNVEEYVSPCSEVFIVSLTKFLLKYTNLNIFTQIYLNSFFVMFNLPVRNVTLEISLGRVSVI